MKAHLLSLRTSLCDIKPKTIAWNNPSLMIFSAAQRALIDIELMCKHLQPLVEALNAFDKWQSSSYVWQSN